MPTRRSAALVVALSFAGCRAAPVRGGLDGRWQASYATAASENVRAELVIAGRDGRWTVQAAGARCAGRSVPVSLTPGPSSTVSLRWHEVSATAGCGERQARLTVVDESTLEGEFDDGRVLRLVRQ